MKSYKSITISDEERNELIEKSKSFKPECNRNRGGGDICV